MWLSFKLFFNVFILVCEVQVFDLYLLVFLKLYHRIIHTYNVYMVE